MLHIFYNPLDLDSCLAAWATQHGLGPDAVALHTGEIECHPDMLLLNRPEDPLEHHGDDAINVLSLARTKISGRLTPTRGNVHLAVKHSPLACCLLAWNRFHVGPEPWLIRAVDKHLDTPHESKLEYTHAWNAVLAQPWTMANLSTLITAFEQPRTRANLLLDGTVVLAYRKLRGDLCPP